MTAPSNNTDKPIVHAPHADDDGGPDELQLARQLCAADIGYHLVDDPLDFSSKRTHAEWYAYFAGLAKLNRRPKRRSQIAHLIAEAEDAGQHVTSVTIDGVTLKFDDQTSDTDRELAAFEARHGKA